MSKGRKGKNTRRLNEIVGLRTGLAQRVRFHYLQKNPENGEDELHFRGIGRRPAERHKWYYIHSNWTGFYNDYKTVVQNGALSMFLRQKAKKIYDDNNTRIKALKSISDELKITALGCKNQTQHIETSPIIYAIYHQTELVRELQTLQSQLTFTSQDFGVLGQLNRSLKDAIKKYGKTAPETVQPREAFYQEYSKQVNNQLQKIFDTLNSPAYKDQLPTLRNLIQQLHNGVQQNTNPNNWYDKSKAFIHNKTLSLGYATSLLGSQWEEVLALLFNQNMQGFGVSVVSQIYQDIHTNRNILADLIFNNYAALVRVPNDCAVLQAGITAKFRRQAQFTIGGSVQPDLALRSVLDDSNKRVVNQFRFVYNNWVALSVFDSRSYRNDPTKTISRSHRQSGRNKMRRARHVAVDASGSVQQLKPTILSQLFEPLAQYINLYMLNTAFWGNSEDASINKNQVRIFDPDFFTNMDKGNHVAPVFLLTKQHAYETCDVFHYFNELINGGQLLWSVEDLFAHRLFLPRVGLSPVKLAEHYGRKVRALRENTRDPIYDVLMENDDIVNFATKYEYLSAFDDLIHPEGNKRIGGRKLKIQFALKASYAAY